MLNSENVGSPSHEHSGKQTSYGANVLRPQEEGPWLVGIIIIIIINSNCVVTRWQWLFYMYTKYEIGY